MKTMRTKRIRTLIILSAYFLMLGFPSIKETCCRHFHHEDEQAGGAKAISAVQNISHHHFPYTDSRPEESSVLTNQDRAYLDAAGCCHHLSLVLEPPGILASPVRYASTCQVFIAISCTYISSDNVSMGRKNPMASDALLGAASTLASLQTTILLI